LFAPFYSENSVTRLSFINTACRTSDLELAAYSVKHTQVVFSHKTSPLQYFKRKLHKVKENTFYQPQLSVEQECQLKSRNLRSDICSQ